MTETVEAGLDWAAEYEKLVRAKERAEDNATVLRNRQREQHTLDVRWALDDLVRALNRLEELDVELALDEVNLADAVAERGSTAVWHLGEVVHCADLVHGGEDGLWAIKEERGGRQE